MASKLARIRPSLLRINADAILRAAMNQAEASQLQPGDTFGGYQIVRMRGAGTYGVVYEALRLPLQRRVALKLLDARLSQHPEALARFEREAQTTATLEHAHIVDVFDVGVVDGRHYLAMECLDGETLAERIARDGALPVELVADIMVPLVSAIALVHERGFIHRDLKPGNIFLAQRGANLEPVLLDFGIVKSTPGAGDTRLTRKGALLGSPAYMSPEQARSQPIDARSDQFSLGSILWECLTGRRLFVGTALWQVLTAVQTADVPSILSARGDLPPAIANAVARLLARDAEGRYDSVRELGTALLPFASLAVRTRWTREFDPTGLGPSAEPIEAHRGPEAPQAAVRPPEVVTYDGVVEDASLPVDAATLPLADVATLPLDEVKATTPLQSHPDPRRPVWIAMIVASLLVLAAIAVTLLRR